MVGSKLFELYSTFTYKELKSLKKLVRSPFFNENDTLVKLFDILNKGTLRENGQTLERTNVFAQLFPGEVYNDLKLRRLMTDLLYLFQEFIKLAVQDNNPIVGQVDLLSDLRYRSLDKHYESIFQVSRRIHEKEPYRNDEYYYHQFLIENEFNQYLEDKFKRTSDTNLQQAVSTLDIFYLIIKLKYCCAIINFRNVVDINHELLFMDEILSHLLDHSYDHVPAIAIYHSILLTLTESDNENHFLRLKKLLNEHAGRFPVTEAKDMYTFAQNYCIKRINKGQSDYLHEILGIYKIVLDKKIIFTKGNLSPWDYKNIVIAGLRIEEFAWTENFIHTFKNRIQNEYRDNAYTYNLAKFHFFRQNYSKVIKLLQKVEYDDVFYNLDSRATLMKTFYEVNDIQALDSHVDSFRMLLRRNKLISRQHKTNYLNLIKFVKKAIRIIPGDERKVKKLKQSIELTGQVADIDWLMTKVKELE